MDMDEQRAGSLCDYHGLYFTFTEEEYWIVGKMA